MRAPSSWPRTSCDLRSAWARCSVCSCCFCSSSVCCCRVALQDQLLALRRVAFGRHQRLFEALTRAGHFVFVTREVAAHRRDLVAQTLAARAHLIEPFLARAQLRLHLGALIGDIAELRLRRLSRLLGAAQNNKTQLDLRLEFGDTLPCLLDLRLQGGRRRRARRRAGLCV